MSSHVFQSDLTSSWSSGVPPRVLAQITTIRSLVDAAFLEHGVQLSGPGPRYQTSDGKVLSLGNIVQRCCSQQRSRWDEAVRIFVANTMVMLNVEDAMLISAEVVRASLRLRIFEEPTINGWPIDDNELGGARESHDVDEFDDSLQGIAKQTVSSPGLPGTKWLLYLERPGCGQMVFPEHLEQWGIEEAEAFALARVTAQFVRPELRARKFGMFLESSESMFFHTRILVPHLVVPEAPHGWFVSAPTRSEVLVAPASAESTGFNRLMHLVKATRERWDVDPYSSARHCWFVPPEGMGLFGENAEAIVMTDESPAGSCYPNVHIRFGDRVHELFGEKTPLRPPPRRVM